MNKYHPSHWPDYGPDSKNYGGFAKCSLCEQVLQLGSLSPGSNICPKNGG